MYEDLLNKTTDNGRLQKFVKVSPSILEQLKSRYNDIPKDYLSFLEEIGGGEIGNASYMIYTGLVLPNELYDSDTAQLFSDVLIFGDDMQGCCAGFDTKNKWQIVEIDSSDMSLSKRWTSFQDFVRDKIHMY